MDGSESVLLDLADRHTEHSPRGEDLFSITMTRTTDLRSRSAPFLVK